jgi:hypothetical protein
MKPGHQGRAVILASIAAFVATGFAWTHSASANVCETKVVRNYLKPVEALPPLRAIPASRELPFGPAGLSLGNGDQSPIMPPGSREVGYTISRPVTPPEGPPNVHLNWLVTAKLARIGRRGVVGRVLSWSKRRVLSVGREKEASLRLRFPGTVGIYRLEISFRNKAGALLGRFGEYVRVIRPTGSEGRRLTLNKTSFLPGETVVAHAEELGVGWIEMNDSYTIEAYDGSTWVRAPITPMGVSLLIGTVVGPGEATSVSRFNPATACWGFAIPPGTSPGLYRFVIDGVSLRVDGRRLFRGPPLSLSAEFQILPG